MTTDAIARFAGYVATLGRGPGRSRPLTREEAQDAMALLLSGQADPMQTGAFLMLLRYRGEDPEEMTGLVLAARAALALPGLASLGVALDWPSYGAGRTRNTPWFLAAAMALGQAGFPVLMHGTNEFSAGMSVAAALAAIGRAPARTVACAAADLSAHGLAYLPVDALCPAFAALLDLRRLFGLRSPVNTAARLLNPADAPAGVDGVFHPPYIETHLAVAERMGRPRLVVLKGGGGEAERNPAKPTALHVWDRSTGRSEITAPAIIAALTPAEPAEPDFAAIWRGHARHPAIEARIVATIALGLAALSAGGDAQAQTLWENRRRTP
jgi:anthranilate phosphoribosyltransferase